jgi:hypothetical protein
VVVVLSLLTRGLPYRNVEPLPGPAVHMPRPHVVEAFKDADGDGIVQDSGYGTNVFWR